TADGEGDALACFVALPPHAAAASTATSAVDRSREQAPGVRNSRAQMDNGLMRNCMITPPGQCPAANTATLACSGGDRSSSLWACQPVVKATRRGRAKGIFPPRSQGSLPPPPASPGTPPTTQGRVRPLPPLRLCPTLLGQRSAGGPFLVRP